MRQKPCFFVIFISDNSSHMDGNNLFQALKGLEFQGLTVRWYVYISIKIVLFFL